MFSDDRDGYDDDSGRATRLVRGICAAAFCIQACTRASPASVEGAISASTGPERRESIKSFTIRGRITAEDGMPIAYAFAGFMSTGRKPVTVIASKDGEFAMHPDPLPGAAFFVGGVHRQSLIFPLVLADTREVKVAIRLAALEWVDSWDNLRIVGSFNDFADDQTAVPLLPRGKGELFAMVPSPDPTLRYQVLGAWKHGHVPVAGTVADGYEHNGPTIGRGPGGIVSVVRTNSRQTPILFSPAALPTSKGPSTFEFATPSTLPSRLARVATDVEVMRIAACGHGPQSPETRARFAARLQSRVLSEPQGLIRDYLFSQYVESGGADKNLAEEILRINALSPIWALGSTRSIRLASSVLGDGGASALHYERQLLASNVDSGIKAAVLFERIVAQNTDPRLAEEAFAELTTLYPESVPAEMARRMRGPRE